MFAELSREGDSWRNQSFGATPISAAHSMWQVKICTEILELVEICKINELQGQEMVKNLIEKIKGYIAITKT